MHSALLPFQEQTNHLIKSRPKLQIQTKSIAAEVWEGALQCHRESPWRLAGRGHHAWSSYHHSRRPAQLPPTLQDNSHCQAFMDNNIRIYDKIITIYLNI